jgi:glucuronate isomerase
MAVDNTQTYNTYIDQLEIASGVTICSFQHLLDALKKRQDFFAQNGCRLSDHGLETFYSEEYTDHEIETIFKKIRNQGNLNAEEVLKFKSAMLYYFSVMDHQKGWAQQFHVGAIRNNNTKMYRKIGPDTGYDAIGDFEIARPMSKFFNRLELEDKLTKTVVYNLNPRDNELMITLAYSYNDGNFPGKMQFGSGWWFLDQKDGMEKQLNALSNMGLLSRFVGMLTDSRSFLSYPRHDYFRRILCNLLGNDLENGELPFQEIDFVRKMTENISYYNAKQYFGF